jgi:demethylmenaquinone methyltransferase / 2-methoxy-6-polyprenyl-1,4-benzoquinol methylase
MEMENQPNQTTGQLLHPIFTAVPPRYDMINHVITLGMDTGWRKLAARTIVKEKPQRVLDIGCGTGDLSVNIAKLAYDGIEITGLDFSQPMLDMAKQKAEKAGVTKRVSFITGNVEQIPFPDNYFDYVGISFAFRNLTYDNPLCRPHFAEVLRVLKPGGRYVIVESSQSRNRIIRGIQHLYLKGFVGPVGMWLSGNKGAYNYLAESAKRYYLPRQVKGLLLRAGFKNITYRELFFGAAGLHVACK